VKIIEKSKVTPGDHTLQTEIDILCRVKDINCVCLKEWSGWADIARHVTGCNLTQELRAENACR
jgi:hypothetical protein